MLRAMARCTIGCDMAEPYTEGQNVGNVKTEGVSLGALGAAVAREALGTSGDKRRRGHMDKWSAFRGEDLIDMSFQRTGDKHFFVSGRREPNLSCMSALRLGWL